ncbi:heavy metal translocating P-type ATPase [Niallia endozanthoxylica]|uniref:heavy metal translocating P-type ATPase n=1 Tax=Niallia endozanthoxylica TaxID=2036016 RepID=UPI00168BAD83|nr:cation-translocating P-type ATPase [Niallia endozanthoxylica]
MPSAKIEAWFRTIPGIYSAAYTACTKSLLFYYDQNFQPKRLHRLLKELDKTAEMQDGKQPSVKKRLSQVSLASLLYALHWFLSKNPVPYIRLVDRLIGVIVLLLSASTIKDAYTGIAKDRKLNSDFLTVCSLLACLYLKQSSSALIIYIMSTVSELLTDMTTMKTKRHLESLIKLEAPHAWKVEKDGTIHKTAAEKIQIDDLVKVFQGERIPVDGVVVTGNALVDESAITGEYKPKNKFPEDEVFSGSICKKGEMTVRVTKTGRETALGRMIQLIEEAYSSKAPTQEYANAIAEKMVGVSFALTIGTYLITRNVNRALSMLVIDFVCGIKLSTAAAFSAAIGKAAKKGALIKSGSHIEQLADIETIVLDKTGTITEGKPYVQKIKCFNGFTPGEVVFYSSSLEQTSTHPLAHAILEAAKRRGITPAQVIEESKITEVTGKGLFGMIKGRDIKAGSLAFLQEQGVQITEQTTKELYSVYTAIDGKLAGAFLIQDIIRPGMKHTIKQLRLRGVKKVVMLTGDMLESANRIARQVQVDKVFARMLPEQKLRFIEKEKRKRKVAMVGDGMNDAPALTKADIGITFGGKRTDLAVEASDVVISNDNPYVLTELIDLSKKTKRTVKQNVIATFVINGGAILLGALGLISSVTGAAIHNLTTIGVVLNSMKILV